MSPNSDGELIGNPTLSGQGKLGRDAETLRVLARRRSSGLRFASPGGRRRRYHLKPTGSAAPVHALVRASGFVDWLR